MSFVRLQVLSTLFIHSVVMQRTWQPSDSTPSTPSWIPGSSSSVASRCFNTFVLCWAAVSAEEPWRPQHIVLSLYLLTVTYSTALQRGRSNRPTCTPAYLCDSTEAIHSVKPLEAGRHLDPIDQSWDIISRHKDWGWMWHRGNLL